MAGFLSNVTAPAVYDQGITGTARVYSPNNPPPTGSGSSGGGGEVAGYTGPPSVLAVSGGVADTNTISVTWNSIAGHRYRITGYLTGDSDATTSTTDVHFVVPGQAGFKYLLYTGTPSAFLYGGATGEFTETATQTRTIALTVFRPAGTFTVRAGSAMLNVEDITPGSSLIVAPASNAPAQNVVLGQVNSTAMITLSASPQLLPGCSYTIPVSGTYEVTYAVDFTFAGTLDGALVAGPYLDGVAVAPVRQAVFFPITANVRQVMTQTALVTATAGQVLTLQSYKASGTGTSTAGGQHSGFTVVLPGTGNLDSDVLNLMGAF